ncbi:type II toxin-antitoxin system RelE family toxin, partial [Micromonospora fulviviridis]
MTARLSLHYKAEEELYKLDRTVKGLFYDFCHRFRKNPDQPGLDLTGSLRSRVAAGHGVDEVVWTTVGASGGSGDVV